MVNVPPQSGRAAAFHDRDRARPGVPSNLPVTRSQPSKRSCANAKLHLVHLRLNSTRLLAAVPRTLRAGVVAGRYARPVILETRRHFGRRAIMPASWRIVIQVWAW